MPAKSVQVDPQTTATEGQGALGANKFIRLHQQEHPSVRAMNAYAEHLSQHVIAFATFCPKNLPKDSKTGQHIHAGEMPYTFNSVAGRSRIINAHESVPIYFQADIEQLKSVDTVRLSKKPLDREVLQKELELTLLSFEELVANAKALSVYESSKDKTRPGLVNACLAAEFTAERMKANTAKAAIGGA